MNKLFLTCGLVLSFFAKSNEISFKSVDDLTGGSIEINFILEKVSFIKSYSLENPSRIVMDVYDSDLSSVIDEPYNYPIKNSPFVKILYKENLINFIIASQKKIDSKYIFFISPNEKDKKIKLIFNKENYNFNGWEINDSYNNNVSFKMKILFKNTKIDKNLFKIPELN